MNNNVNPKGGELIKADILPWSDEKLEREINKLMKAFSHFTYEQAKISLHKDIYAETYVNNIYQVAVYRGKDADDLIHVDELKGRCVWLSIKRRDKRPVNNWQDMQTMKNRLVGVNFDAIQMFPAESRMVNTANQYHLIVLPEDANFPFGWGSRFVVTENINDKDGASQNFRGETQHEH